MFTSVGANGGIGFDTATLLTCNSPHNHVLVGSRNTAKGEAALKKIHDKNPKGTASLLQLDANDDESINVAVKHIEQEFGHLDVLINNAGIATETYDGQWPSRDQLRAEFETNVFGPTVLTAAVLPLLRKSKTPKIINVSSGLGSISRCVATDGNDPNGTIVRVPGYRMTKSALNMLTAYQYQQLKKEGFKVWSFCPGFVVTDLAKDREAREKMSSCESSETSAQGILEIIEGKRDEEVGMFLQKYGKRYDW
jgi:NAD(P)-dependent dehydrogenase (short-subunit alcohol dehydrogenase family)